MPTELPKVVWIAAAGTIACRANSSLEVVTYAATLPGAPPLLDGKGILGYVAEIEKLVDIVKIHDLRNDYETSTAMKFAKIIKDLDPDMPVVISHGTNIVPEVAFLLDIVLDRPAPVVVTGSMQPMSSMSCDGKYNLVQAFALAVHTSARDRGVMITFNDRIGSAFYTSKVSANRLDTFRSHEQGQLGLFCNYTPPFFFTPARATDRKYLEIDLETSLPEVGLVYCYTDIKEKVLDDAVSDPNVQGLVVAAFGASQATTWMNDKLEKLAKDGLPVVRTTAHADSYIALSPFFPNQIPAADLGPAKAKILLQLAIAKHGKDMKKIKQVFGSDFELPAHPV